jgi:hypothetical protein
VRLTKGKGEGKDRGRVEPQKKREKMNAKAKIKTKEKGKDNVKEQEEIKTSEPERTLFLFHVHNGKTYDLGKPLADHDSEANDIEASDASFSKPDPLVSKKARVVRWKSLWRRGLSSVILRTTMIWRAASFGSKVLELVCQSRLSYAIANV